MIAVIVQLMVTTFFLLMPRDERYIEVKSIGWDGKEGAFRFFLSGNELTVSNLSNHSKTIIFILYSMGKMESHAIYM